MPNQSRTAPLRIKEGSPFTPGTPVPVELFVGRTAEIEKIRRYARQACSGRLESIFLSGDRGIGKSSLAQFIKELCAKECNMLGVHAYLGGVSTVDELVRRVFEQLLKEAHTQTWFSKIKGFFGNYIKDVGLLGVSVGFSPPKEQLEGVVRDFPAAIKNVYDAIREEKSGLIIILDDLNGLANQPDFANWYKSFVDYVATHDLRLPVLFVFCGLPERRDSLARLQPSLMRIFHPVEIERLDYKEVEHFFLQAFASAGIRVTTDIPIESDGSALWYMASCCSGLPTLMHEVGDAVYWTDSDGVVVVDDALTGMYKAAEEVGRKYLDPTVFRAVRSPRYRVILDKIAHTEWMGEEFHKQDIEKQLNEHEKNVFGNFLRKMTQLGVIEADRDSGRGTYRFVNALYPIYIRMQSKVAPQLPK